MYWLGFILLWASALAAGQYDSNIEPRSVGFQSKNNYGPLYSSFGNSGYRDNSYEDNAVTPSPSPTPLYRNPSTPQVYRKPTASLIDSSREYQQGTPLRINGNQRLQIKGGQQFSKNGPLEEVEEEKDEPDRLTLLLPQSKFDCVGKQTGYYADEDLNCEVFHYCQDNFRHSWICPEGFTFHQVHLICMPPNGDISCKKSSQYHFVNEYLYKPLNLDEAESKPNVTIRYSERYFPSDIYADERESNEYRSSSQNAPSRRPIYIAQQAVPTINSIPNVVRPQSTASTPQYRLPVNQVFRSPEEVNIPLQQRRPQTVGGQGIRRYPQVRPDEEDYE